MIFGLCEEEGEKLDSKVYELFEELEEKPKLTASRVGMGSGVGGSKIRPVKVVLARADTAKQILAKTYWLPIMNKANTNKRLDVPDVRSGRFPFRDAQN